MGFMVVVLPARTRVRLLFCGSLRQDEFREIVEVKSLNVGVAWQNRPGQCDGKHERSQKSFISLCPAMRARRPLTLGAREW